MSDRKYVFAMFGDNTKVLIENFKHVLCRKHERYRSSSFVLYENQAYDTGLPEKPVISNNVVLHFHGIIFPQQCSIDFLSDNRESVIRSIIDDNMPDLKQIPYSIRNGSYVALVVDGNKRKFVAFTCFLNSIPFYYAKVDNCIIASTDLELLAKALKLDYKLNDGIYEYYASGTNLSDNTAFPKIKCIPKGAYLEYVDGDINIDYYYKIPNELSRLSFQEHVHQFSEIWNDTLASIHSEKFKYGLGFTGGIDSRLILAALVDRKKPLLFTGAHPENPDVILAKHITERLGLCNHKIEDYSSYDRVKGYAKHSAMSDNPFLCNSFHTHEQTLFRREHGLVYELSGLTDFIGGIHYYYDRRNLISHMKMSLPMIRKKMTYSGDEKIKLIKSVLRFQNLETDLKIFSNDKVEEILEVYKNVFEKTEKQIGRHDFQESYLERLRHIYKVNNLLRWDSLTGRRYKEALSPYLNIEMTSFSAQVPIKHRDSRRIFLSYFKNYHPELSHYILSGTIFCPNAPWPLYKVISPYVNVLNHLGIKIWPFQWYIKKYNTGMKMIYEERYAL